MPIPAAPGAYILLISLSKSITMPLRKHPATLPPGRYAYCGSAYGPGGLRARIARHCRPQTPRHWHIDRLTTAGQVVATLARPGETECALLERLRAQAGVSVPIPGFGSTDCRRCPAHLVALPPAFELASLAA